MRKVTTYTCDSYSSSEESSKCSQNRECIPKNNFLDLSAFIPRVIPPAPQELVIQPQTENNLGTKPLFNQIVSDGKWHVNGGNVVFNENDDYEITINMWFQQQIDQEQFPYGLASTYVTINGNTVDNVLIRSIATSSIVFLQDLSIFTLFPTNHTTSTFIVTLKKGDIVGFWATSFEGHENAGGVRAFSKSALLNANLPPWYTATIKQL